MNTIEDRARFDDYEMADDYDFSQGIRGRFYKPKKVRATLQLDDDVLLFLKKRAGEEHVKYQVFLNSLLRNYMTSGIKSAS
ncbi:MAG: BrnA antitoxin family protein [Methylococcaceae bacterium]|jgi:predicted DNA binding CopG/RHH family protein